MFVVTIEGVDVSSHTVEADALTQKQHFIDTGTDAGNIVIVEKGTFSPPLAH